VPGIVADTGGAHRGCRWAWAGGSPVRGQELESPPGRRGGM